MSAFEAEKDLSKALHKSNMFGFVVFFLKEFSLFLGLMVVFEACQKATHILIPYTFKNIIDGTMAFDSTKGSIFSFLQNDIYLFVGLSFATVLFARASGAILVTVAPILRKRVRASLYKYLQKHSFTYFSTNFSGSLANRVNEVSMSLNHSLWTAMFDFLPITISFSVSSYLIYQIAPNLTFYFFVWIFFYVGVSFFLAKKSRSYAKKFAAARSKTTGFIVDGVTNILNTKMFSHFSYENSRLNNQFNSEISDAKRMFWFMEKVRWFQFVFAFILQVGFILYSLQLLSLKQISVGDFTMIATLGLLLINDARGLSRRFLEFFEYVGNISDGIGILLKPYDVVDSEQAESLQIESGEIEFKDVDFGYNEGTKVFEHFNIKIKHGEKVGLVGYSGSGKSTFVNLLLRLYNIQKGSILIDSQDISSCKQDSLRRMISMIPQDPILFHRSLMENIRYGNLEASDEQVIEAAKKARAHEFILETDGGYESLVGERGVKLSGGQRQRIAIARAILKDAPILVLDEATSSLDSITERSIQETIESIDDQKTVIVVAHRLSTVAKMDRILVFNQGKIIEEGSHEELLKNNGLYTKLWSMQSESDVLTKALSLDL